MCFGNNRTARGMENLMKWIKEGIRNFGYFLFRIVLRNKGVQLPLDTSKIKKILILRYDVLGDMIVTTPVFNLLKSKIPSIEIHVLGTKRNVGLLAHDNRIDKVICYEKTFVSLLKIRRDALREKYDCVLPLVFYNTTKAGVWANWVGYEHSVKIGWTNPWRAHLYRALYNIQVSTNPAPKEAMTMSEIQVNLVCTCFGWRYSQDLVKLGIEIAPIHEQYANTYFEQLVGKKTILINISAGNANREIFEETVSELIHLLIETYNDAVILLSATPQDVEKAQRLGGKFFGKVMILPYSPDVLNFCAIVKLCTVVISPDTAIVHIAATFDVPLIALYINSERHCKEWGPQHKKSKIIVSQGVNLISDIEASSIFKNFVELEKQFGLM